MLCPRCSSLPRKAEEKRTAGDGGTGIADDQAVQLFLLNRCQDGLFHYYDCYYDQNYEKNEKQLGKTGGDENRGCEDEHSETQFNENESGFSGIGEAWSEARLRGRLLQ